MNLVYHIDMNKFDLICVVGPTASGKSELAVKLAKKYNGEIISADSRQIYRGLNIGSGKVEGKWLRGKFIYKGIVHHLIDEASPHGQYTVARFQKHARKLIADIAKRGMLPIICGGTGHWIDAVVNEQTLPSVKPNPALRKKLEKLSTEKLFQKLQKVDPERASKIDPKNPRRLIRALEIVITSGKPVPKLNQNTKYQVLWIGLKPNQDKLHKKIAKRLNERLAQGMLKEVKKLKASGLSWQKLEAFGLEYKYCALYLQNQISEPELREQLLTAIKQYAKRQLTWWKKNSAIHWVDSLAQAIRLARTPKP